MIRVDAHISKEEQIDTSTLLVKCIFTNEFQRRHGAPHKYSQSERGINAKATRKQWFRSWMYADSYHVYIKVERRPRAISDWHPFDIKLCICEYIQQQGGVSGPMRGCWQRGSLFKWAADGLGTAPSYGALDEKVLMSYINFTKCDLLCKKQSYSPPE